MKTKLLLTGFVFFVLTAVTMGQDIKVTPARQGGKCQAPQFVDANKDGICDNFVNRPANNRGHRGNGVQRGKNNCPNPGQARSGRNGAGRNFTDENKNGICDRREPVK